jgi:hypothetical protein
MTILGTSGIPVRLTASRAHNAVGHVRRISVPCLCIAGWLWTAFPASAGAANKDSWEIRILPATKLSLAQSGPATSAPAPAAREPATDASTRTYESQAGARPSGQLRIIPGPRHSAAPGGRPSYADVYRSIPFSWAEYAANPSYRSQAALGLMLNQMPYPSTSATQVPQYGYVTPYSFDNTYGTPNFASLFYWFPLCW